MTDDGGEQQEISDVGTEPLAETWQERILRYYNSSKLRYIALGFWLKLITEAVIVSAPLAVLVIPLGAVLAYLNIGPVSFLRTIGAWIALSISILKIGWCLTESNGEDLLRKSDDSDDSSD